MILITRPYSDALKTAEKLKLNGFDCLIEPMLKIKNLSISMNIIFDSYVILITSKNAVWALNNYISNKNIPILVVGSVTTNLIRQHQFNNILCTYKTINDLLVNIEVHNINNILYLRGMDVCIDLDNILFNRGITLHSIIVYEALKSHVLSSVCINKILFKKIKYILFFSNRTAKTFVDLTYKYNLYKHYQDVVACSVSKNVGNVLRKLQWKEVKIAKIPDEDSLLSLVFNKHLSSK